MNSINLIERFQLYSTWRFALGQTIVRYRDWLTEMELAEVQSASRIQRVLDRLSEDKLNIAFVAEFSRGKSELINAIFFADYGKRILPSSAGRTTMCPTELMYDETMAPALRLLPIETRARHASVTEFKNYPDEWHVRPLDTSSGDAMLEAFKHVSSTKRVPAETAKAYGLFNESDPDHQSQVGTDGMIEVPAWRHAVINFPHPLLAQGLVILDTPGLNAIGTEPELTLNLIPNAHAVLFILAADTGVTKSDIDVWRGHIAPKQDSGSKSAGQKGRLVVLNKIDSLWDELRTRSEIDAEIDKQIRTVATTLQLQEKQVFAISAQKGLVAKVHNDPQLLEKSRLQQLETALSDELIPAKQEIVRDFVSAEMRDLVGTTQRLIGARHASVAEQLRELDGLHGKNEDVVLGMMRKVTEEKNNFSQSLLRFQATRAIYANMQNDLFSAMGTESLKEDVRHTREQMLTATFSLGMRDAMQHLFDASRGKFERAGRIVAEITDMMAAMYKKFADEHGLKLGVPMPYSMLRYLKEIDRVEASYHKRFGTLEMITSERVILTRKFFEVVASRIKEAFDIANRDAETWLKSVMAPIEGQIKERQVQLRRRLDSIKRIHQATDTLDSRIAELRATDLEIQAQALQLDTLFQEIEALLTAHDLPGFDVSL